MNHISTPVKQDLRQYRDRPESERWALYEQAKRERQNMEDAGVRLTETYAQFVRRVTDDLEI